MASKIESHARHSRSRVTRVHAPRQVDLGSAKTLKFLRLARLLKLLRLARLKVTARAPPPRPPHPRDRCARQLSRFSSAQVSFSDRRLHSVYGVPCCTRCAEYRLRRCTACFALRAANKYRPRSWAPACLRAGLPFLTPPAGLAPPAAAHHREVRDALLQAHAAAQGALCSNLTPIFIVMHRNAPLSPMNRVPGYTIPMVPMHLWLI